MIYSKRTTDVIIEDWDKRKAKLKQKFSVSAYKAISYSESEKEEMLEILQMQLGISKEEIISIISGEPASKQSMMGLT